MRTLTRSKAAATVAAGTAMALAFGGVALADNLQDNLEGTAPAQTITAGQVVTVSYHIQANGPDGCNVDATNAATMSLNLPSGVTATAAPRFTACGSTQTVTYSSARSGSYALSPTITGGKAGNNGWNTNNARFTLTVKPSVAVSAVQPGAEYVVGAVPTASCDVTGASTGSVASFAAALSGTLTNGRGSQTATCDYTDPNGIPADRQSVTYTIVAPSNTEPSVSVTGVADGATYEIGSVPTAGCDVTDAEDGNSSTSAALSGALSHGLGSQTATCDYTDGGGLPADTARATYTVVDTGNPTIRYELSSLSSATSDGWHNQDVAVDFICDDAGSGVQDCTGDTTLGEGDDQSVTGTATDWAGNTASATASGIKVDKTGPTVPSFSSFPSQAYATQVPAAPTCESSDALSGLASCTVTGYDTSVGNHTLRATATDRAGNTSTATLGYTVSPWTLKGFYAPADMNGTWNTVKGGSTVPLKFEAFAGAELTSTSAVKSFTQKVVGCPGSTATVDEVEIVSTGGTSLRYDTTGGQFVQNWQTPKKPGTCYTATVTTQDGSSASANFMLK